MTENQVQTIQPKQVTSVNDYIEKYRDNVIAVLPSHTSFERFQAIFQMALHKNPDLSKCSLPTIVASLLQSIQIGLEPNTQRGECYLIPYYSSKKGVTECQFMLGYQGLIELVRRSGTVSTIMAREVYKNEKFEIDFGNTEKPVTHIPALSTAERGEILGVYCQVKMKDGGIQVEYMSKEDINAVQARAKSRGFSPWQTDWEMMARKTVFKRMTKYLPLSSEIMTLIKTDETTKDTISNNVAEAKDITDWEEDKGDK